MKYIYSVIIFCLILSGCNVSTQIIDKEETSVPTIESTIETTPVAKSAIQIYEDQEYIIDNTTNFESSYQLVSIDSNNFMNSNVNIHEIVINNAVNNYDDLRYELGNIYLNGDTTLKFDIVGNVDIRVQVFNVDTNTLIFEEIRNINNETYEATFHCNEVSYNGKVVIGFISNEAKSISLENILLQSSEDIVMINQVGYKVDEQKRALFSTYAGNYFRIINVENNEVVYIGNIVNKRPSEEGKEVVGSGDFSTLNIPGTYYVESQYGNKSYEFVISDDALYDPLMNDVFKMISAQTCGHDLSEKHYGEFAHEACHTGEVIIDYYGNAKLIGGGWHDAGDYGRYGNTTEKVIIDLMMSYIINADYYQDNMNTYGSGNNQSDMLDEIRNGLDLLLDLQVEFGGTYHKVSSYQFAPLVLPEDDDSELHAFNVDSPTSAFAAGLFAIGSKLFQDIDEEYSNALYEASIKAYEFSVNNSGLNAEHVEGYSAGIYRDSEEHTEKFFMHMAMYYAYGDEKYLNAALDYEAANGVVSKGVDYINPALYGNYLYLISENAKNNIVLYDRLANEIINTAGNILYLVETDPYYNSIVNNYIWGSNYYVSNNGIILMMAYDLNNNIKFKDAANDILSYLLGRNTLNTSFVTGYGSVYPEYPHHRESIINETPIIGALVGGPDGLRTDSALQNRFDGSEGAANMYIDSSDSYSSNEVAIYYNSALLLLLNQLKVN